MIIVKTRVTNNRLIVSVSDKYEGGTHVSNFGFSTSGVTNVKYF